MQVAREKWGPQIDTASPICLEYNRPVPHARSGRNRRQEGRERSYYDLHCNLNNTLFHFLSKSFLILKFCASSAASPLTAPCAHRLSK